jgi:hypothetical protein
MRYVTIRKERGAIPLNSRDDNSPTDHPLSQIRSTYRNAMLVLVRAMLRLVASSR